MMINVCIAILLPSILGFLLLAIILRKDPATTLGERICLSFPLGAGLVTLQIFFLGLMRIPLTLVSTSVPLFFELILLAVWIGRKSISLVPQKRTEHSLLAEITDPGNGWFKKSAYVVLLIWIGIKILSVFMETGLRPIFAWDAWANWSAGAKIFLNAHSLMLDAATQDFFGKNAVDRNIFYPLHNSLLQLWMSLWLGRFDDTSVKFFSPVYLLCMAVFFYDITSREVGRLYALALLAIVLSSPLLSYHSTEVYSDQMLGVYLLLASASFLKVMRGSTVYCLPAGIFLAEALFIKEEAAFFVIPFLLSVFIYFYKRGRTYANISPLLTPFLALLPWYGLKAYYGLTGMTVFRWNIESTYHFWINSSVISFQPAILGSFLYSMMSLENFNVIFFFFPIMLLASGKASKEILHLLFPVVCYILFFLMLYMFFTGFYSSHSMTLARNMLTCFPTVSLLTAMLLKKLVATHNLQPLRISSTNDA